MRPTIVFVPGAWHPPTTFHLVAHKLQQSGYPAHFITLPSVGAIPPLADMTQDISKIRTALSTLIDSNQPIILVMHSYGGVCGSSALQDLPTTSMASSTSDQKGGIIGLVYVSAFLLPPGVSLSDGVGGQILPWWGISEDRAWMFPTTPSAVFYNDLDDNEAEAAVSVLKSHSYGTFTSKAVYAPWNDIPTTYVFCEKDQAIPIEVQSAMVEKAKEGCKATFKTETLSSGHSPFYSQPDAVVTIVRRAAGEDV